MTLAELSIKRPVFITCALLLTLITGVYFMRGLGADMYPDVRLPFVTVLTAYPGAGPADIENRVTKPLEDSICATAGLKKLTSQSKDGVSVITAEFTLETDPPFALAQVRDKVAAVRAGLPKDISEPTVSLLNMDDTPVMTLALSGDMGEAALYDLALYTVLPPLEQAASMGRVEILGGRKREIQIELDRKRLAAYEISATDAAKAVAAGGKDVSAGKLENGELGRHIRTAGEFSQPAQAEEVLVRFTGNDVPVRIKDLGRATESLSEEKTRAFRNGRKTLLILLYKQSRANTVRVAASAKKITAQLQKELASMPGRASLSVVQDGTRPIAANLNDVKESIFFAILLTVAVVFLFLRNWRSTAITALAIPNSLLGATALMYFAGFTLNLMSLLALSLSVGLLVDDAIVVRENIYRRMQNGEPPERAALEGTNEVRLAVIATSLTVAAVFLPIAFMKGLVGQYFKEFGLTVCFVLLISTFDSLTIAPMLSAYFGRRAEKADRDKKSGSGAPEKLYRKLLCFCLRRPVAVLGLAAAVFAASVWTAASIPAVFLPPAENGEFYVNFEGPAELNLAGMSARALEADETLRKNPLVANTLLQTGARDGESNKASIFVELKPAKKRKISTSQAQEILRRELRKFAPLNPVISDSGQNEAERAVTINITGEDLPALRAFAAKFYERFKHHPAITDPDLSEKPGKPESRVILDSEKAARTGLSPATAGEELRVQLEGTKVGLLRENGREYDIRVKMAGPDRDLAKNFNEILAPNINGRLIKLSRAAKLTESRAPQSVNRVNRARYITFAAGLMPNGPGLQAFMNDMNSALSSELKPPPGIKITAAGDAENYAELLGSVTVALLLGICFIYLVLASLYESFTAPLAILLALPLAASGALFALKAGGLSINVYSIIGCILLLGVAAKNSILLVDRIRFNLMAGTTLAAAVLRAGRLRLRPILMTSCALVAGMLPVAARLNEASAQRVSMGWAVIGGILSSTLMSLFVVPAAYALVYALHKRRAKKTDAKQLLNQTTQQEAK